MSDVILLLVTPLVVVAEIESVDDVLTVNSEASGPYQVNVSVAYPDSVGSVSVSKARSSTDDVIVPVDMTALPSDDKVTLLESNSVQSK